MKTYEVTAFMLLRLTTEVEADMQDDAEMIALSECRGHGIVADRWVEHVKEKAKENK